jgi:CheY-like chemotaxis protein
VGAARAPSSKGFGLTVIQASIEGQLGGRVALDWRPEGLHCTFTIPRAKIMRTPEKAKRGREGKGTSQAARAVEGKRILLAEDEVLVGMMVHEMLTGFGFSVVGPMTDIDAAIKAVQTEAIDGAVLDVNLGGDLIYPVADMLMERGVPFVFVTGYDDDSIDERYVDVPILRKPIEPQLLHRLLVSRPVMAVA